jgi:hypothetical protein
VVFLSPEMLMAGFDGTAALATGSGLSSESCSDFET